MKNLQFKFDQDSLLVGMLLLEKILDFVEDSPGVADSRSLLDDKEGVCAESFARLTGFVSNPVLLVIWSAGEGF